MFGKPEWFTYRVFGWGLQVRTWQGLVYLAGWMAVFALTIFLPMPDRVRPWVLGSLGGLFLVDILHILSRLKDHHDERERHHQLIIERNCSFAAVSALSAVLLVKLLKAVRTGSVDFEVLAVAGGVLVVMGLTKFVSTLYVQRKM